MKALFAVAAAGAALVASAATAGAATGSDATGPVVKPDAVGRWGAVQPSPRFWIIEPNPRGFGAIGRWGAVRPNAAGFRW